MPFSYIVTSESGSAVPSIVISEPGDTKGEDVVMTGALGERISAVE
jgi:hypothetical protein